MHQRPSRKESIWLGAGCQCRGATVRVENVEKLDRLGPARAKFVFVATDPRLQGGALVVVVAGDKSPGADFERSHRGAASHGYLWCLVWIIAKDEGLRVLEKMRRVQDVCYLCQRNGRRECKAITGRWCTDMAADR